MDSATPVSVTLKDHLVTPNPQNYSGRLSDQIPTPVISSLVRDRVYNNFSAVTLIPADRNPK